MTSRRSFLAGSAAAAGLALVPAIAAARAATDKRLVFVMQRGAADGLSTLAPVGDPAFVAQRGVLATEFAGAARLDALFALNPAMTNAARLYAARQAMFVHAVASPYRDRSHFDAQDVLETGGAAAYSLKTGWMNRLLGLLDPAAARAIAVSTTIPVALRGSHAVSSYAPSNLPDASQDLMARVGRMYADDTQLHGLWTQAMATRAMAGEANGPANAQAMGALAARLLAPANGARVAMVETGGWDTHAGQAGRLGFQLRGLDGLIAALETGLGPAWNDTLVIVATEFGRTVKVNGTGGTDHGTASAAMLFGGGLGGGRIVADWPGLAEAQLYEGRDLRPTLGLDATIASAVARHYAFDFAQVARTLFPESRNLRAVDALVRL